MKCPLINLAKKIIISTVKPVLTGHCHERPPVLTDHTFLAEGPTFKYNWTCHQRPPVMTDHIFMANGVVFQERFYCTSHCYIKTPITCTWCTIKRKLYTGSTFLISLSNMFIVEIVFFFKLVQIKDKGNIILRKVSDETFYTQSQ